MELKGAAELVTVLWVCHYERSLSYTSSNVIHYYYKHNDYSSYKALNDMDKPLCMTEAAFSMLAFFSMLLWVKYEFPAL